MRGVLFSTLSFARSISKTITRRNDSSQLDDRQPQQSDNENDGLTKPVAGLAMSEDADELMNDNYPRPVSWVTFAGTTTHRDAYVLDGGCTQHMGCNERDFVDLKPTPASLYMVSVGRFCLRRLELWSCAQWQTASRRM
jgi:hypothetical protein